MIIVGGNDSDKIYILDTLTETARFSHIRAPKKGSHLINKMGNEFLINTFIKDIMCVCVCVCVYVCMYVYMCLCI